MFLFNFILCFFYSCVIFFIPFCTAWFSYFVLSFVSSSLHLRLVTRCLCLRLTALMVLFLLHSYYLYFLLLRCIVYDFSSSYLPFSSSCPSSVLCPSSFVLFPRQVCYVVSHLRSTAPLLSVVPPCVIHASETIPEFTSPRKSKTKPKVWIVLLLYSTLTCSPGGLTRCYPRDSHSWETHSASR